MTRILLTGMSGTGKSTVIGELAMRGYHAVDFDSDQWSEWVAYIRHPDAPEANEPALEWVWRSERIRALLAAESDDPLIVSGCASNMAQFYEQFDHIVLLSAPAAVIAARLNARTNNPYGKQAGDLARVLGHIETVEPLLRERATLEIDTRLSVDEVVRQVLRLLDGEG